MPRSFARFAPATPGCIRERTSPAVRVRSSTMAIAVSPTITPAPCLSACACVRTTRMPDVSRWLPTAIASSGSACPTEYASVTRTTRHVTSPVAASAATAARTGPAHGTITRPALTPTTKPLDSRATGRRVRKRNGRSRMRATRSERRLAARTKSITIASVRRRSWGRPSALRRAAPASVNAVNETTRPAITAKGRHRLSLAADPASRSGSTGSTHGESAVTTPARNAIPRRTSTRTG